MLGILEEKVEDSVEVKTLNVFIEALPTLSVNSSLNRSDCGKYLRLFKEYITYLNRLYFSINFKLNFRDFPPQNWSLLHLHLPMMCWAPLEHTRAVAIYRHMTRGVKSFASKTGQNIRINGHQFMSFEWF